MAAIITRTPFRDAMREQQRRETALKARRALDEVLSRAASKPAKSRTAAPLPGITQPLPMIVVKAPPEPEPEVNEPEVVVEEAAHGIPETGGSIHFISSIIAAVVKLSKIPREDIMSDSRKRPERYARYAIAMIARDHTRHSISRVARALGRDHTTLLNGFIRADAAMKTDRGFESLIRKATQLARQMEKPHA